MFMDRKAFTCSTVRITQSDPKSQHTRLKAPTPFLEEMEKPILKFMWNCSEAPSSHNNLKKE